MDENDETSVFTLWKEVENLYFTLNVTKFQLCSFKDQTQTSNERFIYLKTQKNLNNILYFKYLKFKYTLSLFYK